VEKPPKAPVKAPGIRAAFIRTMAIVTYFDFLYSGYLGIPARGEEADEVVKQHLNIKKKTPEKKQCLGRSKYETIYYDVSGEEKLRRGFPEERAENRNFPVHGKGALLAAPTFRLRQFPTNLHPMKPPLFWGLFLLTPYALFAIFPRVFWE
jgi:hypothetical protein